MKSQLRSHWAILQPQQLGDLIQAEADRLRSELAGERTAKVAAEQNAAVAAEMVAGLLARLADGQARVTALKKKEQDNLAALDKAESRERSLSERMHELLAQVAARTAISFLCGRVNGCTITSWW